MTEPSELSNKKLDLNLALSADSFKFEAPPLPKVV